MKKILYLLIAISAFNLLFGCVTAKPNTKSAQISSVAVVSLAVNNYGFFGMQGMINPTLIEDNVNVMLEKTEEILSQRWTVKPASSFVSDSSYRDLSIGKAKDKLFTPTLDGKVMPSFTDNRKEIIRGVLKAETAMELCNSLGVDAVVLVYSEWMTDSGKFVPTIKALTKNCFSMYAKDGSKIFFDRKDIRGAKVIGGPFAGVHINEETIDQWVNAFASGAEQVLKRHM